MLLQQKLKEALEIKGHEAELLTARLQQCAHSRMIEEIEAAKEQVVQAKEALTTAAQKEADADAKTKQIEGLMSKSGGTEYRLTVMLCIIAVLNSFPTYAQAEAKRTR
jgi:hypothetical protein